MMNRTRSDRSRPLARLTVQRRTLCALGTLAACAVLGACAAASDDDADGPPAFGALPPAGPSGVTPGAGGTGSAAVPPANNPVTQNPNTEGQTGSGTPNVNNGLGGTGSQTGASSGGTSNAGVGGSVSAGGSAQTDPNGAAGSGMQAAAGAAPVAGAGGGAPEQPEPPAPTGPDIDCPAGASFCSGFENGAFPAGTMTHAVGPGSEGAFAFDTAESFAGTTSLSIPATGSGGFFYRALAVPVPGNDFWVRLYMNLSTPLGDNSHDSVFGASTGGIAADVNNEALVELSEQFNETLLNTDDALFNPTTNNTLPANTWLCMEAHYNGGNGNVEIFADGQELINAPGYRTATYQSFRIGYMRYNDDRTVRYDDVVVAPARVGCN